MQCYPDSRIVCLTEETVETLYLLGQQDRIVGITGYAVRPKGVRQEKPRVGAFTSADIPKIMALEPDLVLTFSDLQADISAELIRNGVTVLNTNQRSVKGILAMIRTLGALTGVPQKAETLAASYEQRLETLADQTHTHRPKVYIEEWDEPMIAGIRWVSELVKRAGGQDIFADRAQAQGARDRFVTSEEVIAAQPDIIIASWCGKKVRPEKIAARDGWQDIPAVRNHRIHEIKSPLLLQPGPAALTDGLDAVIEAIKP